MRPWREVEMSDSTSIKPLLPRVYLRLVCLVLLTLVMMFLSPRRMLSLCVLWFLLKVLLPPVVMVHHHYLVKLPYRRMTRVLFLLHQALLRRPPRRVHHQPLAEIELPTATLEKYVGDYTLPDRIVNIKREGKFLRATDVNDGKPGWNTLLFPEAENSFYFNYENVVYKFISSGDQVKMLNVYENGQLIEEAKRK